MQVNTEHTLTIKLNADEVAKLHNTLHMAIGRIQDSDHYAQFARDMYSITASFLSDT